MRSTHLLEIDVLRGVAIVAVTALTDNLQAFTGGVDAGFNVGDTALCP